MRFSRLLMVRRKGGSVTDVTKTEGRTHLTVFNQLSKFRCVAAKEARLRD